MPAKNTIKNYVENSYYHIYNRGVDKREIFLDEQDCSTFLYYLKLYLSPPESLKKEQKYLIPRLLYKITNLNLSKEIDLLAFALMPNHFHLHIKQYTKNAIEKFSRRVLTSYSQYFNCKYKRIGTLFESSYKAVLVENNEQYLYLSSYIHRNPLSLINPKLNFVKFSSYPYYLIEKHADWVRPNEILSYFRSSRKIVDNDRLSYQSFIEDYKEEAKEMLKDLTIEDDY